jgi:hypothetical protein
VAVSWHGAFWQLQGGTSRGGGHYGPVRCLRSCIRRLRWAVIAFEAVVVAFSDGGRRVGVPGVEPWAVAAALAVIWAVFGWGCCAGVQLGEKLWPWRVLVFLRTPAQTGPASWRCCASWRR